jgi:hypothetical protein
MDSGAPFPPSVLQDAIEARGAIERYKVDYLPTYWAILPVYRRIFASQEYIRVAIDTRPFAQLNNTFKKLY